MNIYITFFFCINTEDIELSLFMYIIIYTYILFLFFTIFIFFYIFIFIFIKPYFINFIFDF